ncbi:MAG: potassium transporter TrkA [Clostridiales bacterium GWF2_38_85]|nr:MAG: potassium transporter TrkA [Clostridiales bacterium GWF2_38_85]HBL83984.1 potassium transporter TrkA [Clostridiales bacterium]
MEIFKNNKKDRDYTIIIGCGRLGTGLADSLSDRGGNVLVIDNDKDAFRKLPPSYGGLTLIGDATDIDVLHEAQIKNANAVVCVTNNDNTNIMIAQIAKELFKIEHVIARLYDPERECVYREFGIATICPAVLSANEIRKLLGNAKKEDEVE